MIRCYITNRAQLPPWETLAEAIARSLDAGVDWIQIREKDLEAGALFHLVEEAVALAQTRGARVIVNTRVDVALAAGAAGAHLPSGSPPPRAWSRTVPAEFMWGVSCHSIDEVRAAEQNGAGYVVFGPVFAPLSKLSGLAPRGLDELARAARSVSIPVLALGGVTLTNAQSCVEAGAAGVAGISLFQS
jgi:thiamine-phosphate pyrophosphorylase